MARSLESASTTAAPAFDDLAKMLESTRPDLLDIITPPPTHLDFIAQAVAHGVERIVCQKPFCRDLDEARKAVALCRENDVDLVVHENFRFQPWYREIKSQIEAGAVGDLQQITFRLRTGDGQGPRAYLDRQPYFQSMPRLLIHETAVHWIDTFVFLIGRPDWIWADLRRMNPVIAGEDAAYFVMGYRDGRRALFDGNRLLDHAAENHRKTLGECLVEGAGGTLSLTGDGAVHLRRFGAVDADTVMAARDWPGFAGDCVYALQKHVIDAMRGDGIVENTGAEYLRILQYVEAAYISGEKGIKVEV